MNFNLQGLLDLLANRCLAQGTNAWTATDHTAYTMETAGSEGFLNLLPIYLDHVLYPTLKVSIVWSIALKPMIVKWSPPPGIVLSPNAVIWPYIKSQVSTDPQVEHIVLVFNLITAKSFIVYSDCLKEQNATYMTLYTYLPFRNKFIVTINGPFCFETFKFLYSR